MDIGRMEAVPPGTVHLDTVRALHQTVVSLRNALEVSKNDLRELKEKYQQHSQCTEFADVIEKLTLENHVLRRRIIDSVHNGDETSNTGQNIKLEVTYSPRSQRVSGQHSEIIIKTATPDVDSESIGEKESVSETSEVEDNRFCSTEKLDEILERELEPEDSENLVESLTLSSSPIRETKIEESSQASISRKDFGASCDPGFKTKLELLSKFDVRIKVRTIKEGAVISSTTSDTDSSAEEKAKKRSDNQKPTVTVEHIDHFEEIKEDLKDNQIKVKSVSTENIKMAVPNEAEANSKCDKFDVQVKITSEENLVVKEGYDRDRSKRKDTLNLDVDDLSFRSMSEGDNSVFSEGHTPDAAGGGGGGAGDGGRGGYMQSEQEVVSENESEEVDDIELIFTTDESKDMSDLKEDLVSIREGEPWSPSHISTTHSTPVLIKFHTLDPDFQPGGETRDNFENENQENSSLQSSIADTTLKQKRVSLPNSDKDMIRHVGFSQRSLDLPSRGILKSCDNKSDNMLFKRSPNASTRRLDSVDSLTCEYNRNLSLDTTKSSSFELGSSMDMLQRDESVDNFQRNAYLGHRFSVFAETDISKCGISEDDLSGNLNRRNTCPNPFQYRAFPHRGLTRPIGPLKATGGAGAGPCHVTRPIVRERVAAGARRENVAQTDVCALPPRWSSDGYLAHKVGFSIATTLPTLPQRTPAPPTTRRLTVPSSRPLPRTDHTRRQLLSDIGFTSMVPELSRSADPLCALEQRACGACGAEPAPAHLPTTSTAKYISRGRSPHLSVDRSNDWTLQFNQKSHAPATSLSSTRLVRSSLPDVRGDDTDELIDEAETFLRRSIDNLHRHTDYESDVQMSRPYIPGEPRHLRLGHAVKIITPQGRIAVGRVRYVGLAGDTAANSGIMVGAILPLASYPWAPLNDGTHRGRRYFHAPARHAAVFVPFGKVVMAWAN